MSTSPNFDVVSPEGRQSTEPGIGGAIGTFPPAPPLDDLDGKRIALIWTAFTNGNILVEAFGDLLQKRFPTMTPVKLTPGRNVQWGDYPDPSLPALAREERIDAAIITAGC